MLKNTDLAADYAAGKFEVLEQDAYLTLVIDCLRRLRPDLVIHRVTGDGPGELRDCTNMEPGKTHRLK